jgi:hypothetical protein
VLFPWLRAPAAAHRPHRRNRRGRRVRELSPSAFCGPETSNVRNGASGAPGSLSTLRLVDFHGLAILRLTVDWAAGVLSIDIGAGDGEVAIRSSGLRRLSVVWAVPGAPSQPISRVDVGHEKLNIEIQGGGHISIEASSIEMPDRA